MKIVFLAHYKWPHVGGVEKHCERVVSGLQRLGHKVITISEEDIKYPHIKFIGLIYIWFWLFKNRKLIETSDLVHIHDVFIWYLPFKFLYPGKKIVTTIHGLEWDSPLNKVSMIQKRITNIFSNKSVGVGDFLEKYIKIKFDLMIYGATTMVNNTVAKTKYSIVYVGRLEENTGILEFLKWFEKQPKGYHVDFCGDGPLRPQCEKYGTVHGFTDPISFLKKAECCVPGGYLAALEGLVANCKLKLFWNNEVKEDYWKMSPFYKLKGRELHDWAKKQTWDKLANEYINLYHNI